MKKSNKSEQGSALVAVLCVIFLGGILTASVLSISKYNSFTILPHIELQKSMYINEGAATRIQYLIAAERSLYPNDGPGQVAYEDYEHDRFLADGVVHVMDYYGTPIEFTIHDARSGFRLDEGNHTQVFNQILATDSTNTELSDLLDLLTGRLTDYIDTNDTTSVNGFEEGDYEELELLPLPRNEALQFREELLWIPDFTSLFSTDKNGRLSSVQIIPPPSMSIENGNPSLFGADYLQIATYMPTLDDEEIEEVLDAIKVYQTDRTALDDQLDVLTIEILYNMSWQESGAYTVTLGPRKTEVPDTIMTADAQEGTVDALEIPQKRQILGTLTFTYNGFDSDGPPDDTIEYMEWIFL